jgi:CheY-like chemotaxis protein
VARRQEGGKIHLLLTGVVTPELGGRELADRLIAEYPNLKVLFLSGYPGDSQLGHGVLDPGLSFLQKPFSPAQLSQRVRESLDAPVKLPASKLAG